jgi:mono/diheme cytochrome c family protein
VQRKFIPKMYKLMQTMKNITFKIYASLAVALVTLMVSCKPAEGEHAGKEYMPDMFHSIAFEGTTANYYKFNTWSSELEYTQMARPRTPVKGTIPFGSVGLNRSFEDLGEEQLMKSAFLSIPVNGHVPFYYDNNEEERIRATNEILVNPLPITEKGLKRGKLLYDINCGICHGEKVDGNGYLARDGSPYPAQPANFLLDEFINTSEGRYYYAIMYGKNVMGAYADKLSYEERWDVIHYIRSVQAKENGKLYNEEENTFNTAAIPGSTLLNKDLIASE